MSYRYHQTSSLTKLLVVLVGLSLSGILLSRDKEKVMKDRSDTTQFFPNWDMHRYATNANWINLDKEIHDGYLGLYPNGGGHKVRFVRGNLVEWHEWWRRNDVAVGDIYFNITQIDIRNKDKDYLFFIKKNNAFVELDYADTELLERFYMYDKEKNLLKKCHQYIDIRTELFFDGNGNVQKICHYDRSKDGEKVTMKNCKTLYRQLRPGEIPYF